MNLKTPPYLKIGDTVAIVSTARKISETELLPAINLLNEWGLKVLLGKTIGSESDQFAGDDVLRTQDFQRALDDENINVIWCARGGYGTIRIVDALDFSNFQKHPKWIVGYSDITVLHSHIHNLGIETIHAQMCLEIEKRTQQSRDTLKTALFGNLKEIKYTSVSENNIVGTAEGHLIGGNLSVLYSLIGSNSEVNSVGKILFIEDLDEMLYHIDRMLQNLKRSGFLENLAGLIVGGMSEMRDNTIPFGKTANQVIAEIISEYNFPVCYDFPAGHIEDNRALLMGRKVKMEVSENGVILSF